VDPFLFAHQWGRLAVFDLARNLRTIAIRDQMVRAEMLGDRLPAWLELTLGRTYRDWPILVIGGGACGLTAAVALASQPQQFRIDVVEVRDIPFYAQANCATRWIDPTQYDWPMDHWSRGRHQWDTSLVRDIPFPWFADRSERIVQNQWIPRLNQHRQRLRGQINFLGGTRAELQTLTRLRRRGRPVGPLQLRLRNLRTRRLLGYRTYSAIVVAAGFGAEHCTLDDSPDFAGLSFWSTDPFESVACGLGSNQQQGTVLISGSGDGALQDFLRIVTRQPSVREIYQRLGLGAINFDRAAILSAELRTERALNWGLGPSFAGPFIRDLHRVHEGQVNAILSNALRQQVLALAAGRPAKTILVSRHDVFSCTYALNRFLTLLIVGAIRDGTVEVRSNCEVDQITPLHPPAGPMTPEACVGYPWRVALRAPDSHASRGTVDANVVVLRHGLDPPEVVVPSGHDLWMVPRPLPVTHLY
jgi:hypothetical protein